jgi:hypothetical protein
MAKEQKSNDKWKITTKRYVGYIDILGFKEMLARKSNKTIYEMMKKVNYARTWVKRIAWEEAPSQISTMTYSDSILIYSKNDSELSLEIFLCSIAAIYNELLLESIPHKGACAYGLMTLDPENSIFFGQPLIDAYLLQNELYFYGIVLHANIEERLKRLDCVRSYKCPFKNGSSNHLTIEPLYLTQEMKDEDEEQFKKDSKKLYSGVEKLKYKSSGSIRKYVDNTEEYLNLFQEKENQNKNVRLF